MSDDTRPTAVGIAVVEYDDRFLVGTRDAGSTLAGKAEFPGGKCEPGESPADCACRECLEETGLRVTAVRLLEECSFDYPFGQVNLHFWLCRPACIEDVDRNHAGFVWIERQLLGLQRFPDANTSVVESLTSAD